ncbi:hypothetical protein BIW11_05223 [Tropilaelaps mercedesae]|uniref:Uncharacterized protein n=1 Tax=Tropilaelaps mercedesae TaxID=418985 RepID=A0A1V9Y3D2_9ACAR|nr:hypothetical protein BIW11_05223 [Tropilaelaps mercedesae]
MDVKTKLKYLRKEIIAIGDDKPELQTTCFYCTLQQSSACTGLQGPPVQVNEAQAACLLQYCPVTGRRRRSLSSSQTTLENENNSKQEFHN